MTEQDKEIRSLLTELLEKEEGLSTWECNFLESIEHTLQEGLSISRLSLKQVAKIRDIAERLL